MGWPSVPAPLLVVGEGSGTILRFRVLKGPPFPSPRVWVVDCPGGWLTGWVASWLAGWLGGWPTTSLPWRAVRYLLRW